ncbi:hypothetical protein [Streptomyces atratus]|uniref:hypothetical protein n=1 Tax=Streptomyces atratus TaxID=1893 RepID=UPI003661796E
MLTPFRCDGSVAAFAPAARAEELFRELARRYEPGASQIADEMLDRIDLADGAETEGVGGDEPGVGRALMTTLLTL